MSSKHRKTVNRRKFLKGSVTLGVTALTQHLLGGVAPPVQASDASKTPEPPVVSDGAAADDFSSQVYLPSIFTQRPLAHGPSKLGLHTCAPSSALDFVQAVHDAGAHVALVKALDNFGYLRLVKEISPETVTVARWNGIAAVNPAGDPAEKAAAVMYGPDGHMERWKYEKDVVDYWEILNENDPVDIERHVWLAQFYIEAMQIAEDNGYKLALLSYSVGVPQWHEWEAIVETGVFARAKEGGHILSLHEYNWVKGGRWGEATEDLPPYEDRGVLTGRYRYLYRDFLIPRDEVVPLAITEAGLDPPLRQSGEPRTWKDRYVEAMTWEDTKLREDDYVIGTALFTLGGYGVFEYHNYEELLWPNNPYGANFLDYIVSLKDA